MKIKKIIVHCSATRENENISAATIKRWHTKERGWSDIGYHYVIHLDGTIVKGRKDDVVGAHCLGHNANSLGVCYIGGLDKKGHNPKDTRTLEQKIALQSLLKTLTFTHPGSVIYGHRDFSNKACPSFDATSEYSYISDKTFVYEDSEESTLSLWLKLYQRLSKWFSQFAKDQKSLIP